MTATYVYRAYDDADRLLYVGIAEDVEHRIVNQHAVSSSSKMWTRVTTRITISNLPTRTEALAEERHAIQTEDPVFNIAGRPRKRADRWRAAYPSRHADDVTNAEVAALLEREYAERLQLIRSIPDIQSPSWQADLDARFEADRVEAYRLQRLVRNARSRALAPALNGGSGGAG